jgi:serine/threonine-protein kinase
MDRALDAVCLKAMATKPEDRYATPLMVAEDIERWMADEPVTAWREPHSRRARRWARHNRVAVATAAAALLVALAGTAGILAVQTQANRDLREANQRTLQERDLARHHFELAQQNFQLARRAVDDYLTRVGENPLLKEQGLHDLRQELLEAALRYYGEFLNQRGYDPSLRAEAAAAQERVGDIQIELGHHGDALGAYDQALALIGPLVSQGTGDPTSANLQVRLEAGRLHALEESGRNPEAIAAFNRARGLGEALLSPEAKNDDVPEILARTYQSTVVVFRRVGRVDDAHQAALRSHEFAERATRERPADVSAARTRLLVATQVTHMLRRKGHVDKARRLCEHDIAFGKDRVRERSRDVELRYHLAFLEGALGELEQFEGRPLEALKLLRTPADSLGALARENPLLFRLRNNWANSLLSLSNLQTDLGQLAEAIQSAKGSIDLFEALARELPSNSQFRTRVGWGHIGLGKAYLKAGSRAEGLAMLRKAVKITLESSSDDLSLYNVACCFALASSVADPAEGPAAAERQRRDADRAVATIRRAIAKGFADASMLKTDPDLNSIRSRPDFQMLIMDLAMPEDPFAK